MQTVVDQVVVVLVKVALLRLVLEIHQALHHRKEIMAVLVSNFLVIEAAVVVAVHQP
jgi:hypothetical protein